MKIVIFLDMILSEWKIILIIKFYLNYVLQIDIIMY